MIQSTDLPSGNVNMLKLSDSRRELLHLIKKNGQVTLNQAAKQTGLSRTTLREHFTNLEYEGYVQRSSKREGRGRPELVFKLTDSGHRLFPSSDGLLLRSLISHLKTHKKEDYLDSFFSEYWNKRTEEAKHRLKSEQAKTIEDKIKILQNYLEEQGFMPNILVADSGTLVIEECNCPFTNTVKETRLPCKLEAKFLQDFFAATLDRVTYIPEGNHACTYQMKLVGKK